MEEEANDNDGSDVDDPPPSKRKRTEALTLDEDEAEIASGLSRIHDADRAASQLEQDRTGRKDGDSGYGEEDGQGSEKGGGGGGGGGAFDDYSGDGHTGFEDNGVCP
jgi:hypothetical protein